ncbi:MAG: hypothetical protein BWY80_00638 [Firmicutes bacterium ADurb.Bin456]|nr:MAG: hypothetical protein BWY80_00638 [Firmicutes bacterium ADurb.Bin456]
MPVKGFRLCADAYAGDLAPFLGVLKGIPKVLTLYRQHGGNYFSSRLTKDCHAIKKSAKQYVFEHEQLKKALAGLGIESSIELNNHLPYLLTAYILEGEPAFRQMVSNILRCPVLGLKGRLYHLRKLMLKRL